MLTKTQYHTALGLVTLLVRRRTELDATEKSAADFFKELGVEDNKEPQGMQILDWVREAVYNEGDDPIDATKALLESLNLEVEDDSRQD